MRKLFLSILFMFFAFSSFAVTIEKEEIPSVEMVKPLDCSASTSVGFDENGDEITLEYTADTCENALDMLILMMDAYFTE